MNSVAVEVEIDVPDGVTIRGYERHQGANAFEVDFDLPVLPLSKMRTRGGIQRPL